MNEQLRKAIEEVTNLTSFRLSIEQAKISEENGNSVPWYPHDKVAELVQANDKLMRVIELLVAQRSILVSLTHCGDILTDETLERMNRELDAISAEKVGVE